MKSNSLAGKKGTPSSKLIRERRDLGKTCPKVIVQLLRSSHNVKQLNNAYDYLNVVVGM